ncbi:MAG: RluA family pseudouridine synthase [Acidobacteriota bacterium]|nr:RluA family pseudouridine synthase [Acidobacteriota bacterium]
MDAVTRLRVPETAAGERLDRFLADVAEIGSRAAAERLLRDGRVLVDGAVRPKSMQLAGGEELEFDPPAAPASDLVAEEMDLVVPFEDEHLLVVDKPAGLVVHPAPGHARGTLVHGLLAYAVEGGDEPERPGIVHRLDRDTSGLMVVARSPEAHRRLQQLVQRRALRREYLALVAGRPRSRRGTIDAPIGRDRNDPMRHSLDTDTPRDAVTHFAVEELFARHALLRVTLETGRTHQIRVHLAAVDLPVAGDPLYGRAGDLGLERQFLHAARLAFPHPMTGEPVEVASALPPDLEEALATLRA